MLLISIQWRELASSDFSEPISPRNACKLGCTSLAIGLFSTQPSHTAPTLNTARYNTKLHLSPKERGHAVVCTASSALKGPPQAASPIQAMTTPFRIQIRQNLVGGEVTPLYQKAATTNHTQGRVGQIKGVIFFQQRANFRHTGGH